MIDARLDVEALLAKPMESFGGPTVGGPPQQFQVDWLVNDRRGSIAYEAFAGKSTVDWAFFHDEIHLITGGEAEVTYTIAPNHRRVQTKRFSAGDVYIIPCGARARFDVISEDPYLHVCVIMPRFELSKDERINS